MRPPDPPQILTVPSTDAAFRKHVDRLRRGGIRGGTLRTPEEFEARLRRLFPRAVVRRREISGEPAAWYVYRDGGWRPSMTGSWWEEAGLPRIEVSPMGWLEQASPTALDLLGIDDMDLGKRHFTDFVAPGGLEDSMALFGIVAEGNELTATALLRPSSGDVIAIDIHAWRDGDRMLALMRLADGVEIPESTATEALPPAVDSVPAADAAFRGYVDLALSQMPEPTLDGLALRLRRLYPHAQVVAEDDRWTAHRDRAEPPADDRAPWERPATEDAIAAAWWVDPDLPRVRYDEQALILEANPAVEALLGRALVGHHWQEFVTPGSTEQVSAMLAILAEVGHAESRFRMPRADGSLLEFDSYTEVDGEGFTTVMRPRD